MTSRRRRRVKRIDLRFGKNNGELIPHESWRWKMISENSYHAKQFNLSGREEALEIETEDGAKTILIFKALAELTASAS